MTQVSAASRVDFDAVVIGSGMGGLTAAALLARLHGRRVLVLVRHWRAGGLREGRRSWRRWCTPCGADGQELD